MRDQTCYKGTKKEVLVVRSYFINNEKLTKLRLTMVHTPPQLSLRLQAMARAIPRGSIVADIGSDHGLLPEFLAVSGQCPQVFAADINPGPFERLQELEQRCLQVSALRGDGLQPLLHHNFTCLSISGLGGIAIRDILQREQSKLQDLTCMVLQPNNKERELRQFLIEHGWSMREELVEEAGVWYEIMVCTNKKWVGECTEANLMFGFSQRWRHQPSEFIGKWEYYKHGLIRAIHGLGKAQRAEVQGKKTDLLRRLSIIQQYINKAKLWKE